MPKQKKEESSKKFEEIPKEELEEILDGDEENTEDEKDILGNIDENRFTEFVEVENADAPVLNKIQSSPQNQNRIMNLEEDTNEPGIPRGNNESEEFNYKISNLGNQDEEPKYINQSVGNLNPLERTPDMVFNPGRQRDLFEKQEIGFNPMHKDFNQNSNIEKYTMPKKLDPNKNQDLFGKKEVKYKPGY